VPVACANAVPGASHPMAASSSATIAYLRIPIPPSITAGLPHPAPAFRACVPSRRRLEADA
jgi:hypothetical protein